MNIPRPSCPDQRLGQKRSRRSVLAIVLALLLSQVAQSQSLTSLSLAGPLPALAAGTLYVDGTNGNDSNSCVSSSTPCKTIGGALAQAASGDTINIGPGTYSEHLTISTNLTLAGTDPRTTIIDGGGSGTVITVNGGTTASIDNLTIQNGNAPQAGGGIASRGTLTIVNSTITGNVANGANDRVGYGGGGIVVNGGSTTIRNSTIANNKTTSFGAGIDIGSGAATIVNSTVANNQDTSGGGGSGIITWGATHLAISNSTVAGNTGSATGGNGIYNYGITVAKNTIVAGNGTTVSSGTTDCRNDNGSMTDDGYNIEDQTGCGFTASTSSQFTDPLLSSTSPANNGGPTDTIAVNAGSPAIGAGSCTDVSGNPVTTDQRGVSRPVSACTVGAYEAERANDTWASALTLPDVTNSGGQTVTQHIYAPTQEHWYKFAVTPGSAVHVSFQGDPGSVVSLHSDLQASYTSLNSSPNPAVESTRDAPSGYLPSGYLPSGYLPSGYLPSGYLPSGYLPSGYLPSGYLPSGYLPSGYLPSGYLPSGYLPSGYLPSGYLPGPYTGAVWNSLLAIAAAPNSTTQTIDRNTWNSFGYFYVRVAGPANRTAPFSINVRETGGICKGVTPIAATPPSSRIPTGLTSLILWDSTRITGSSTEVSNLETDLGTLATKENGTVVDLSSIPGIDSPASGSSTSAEGQADAYPSCPTAKNIVADDIKSVVRAYRAQNPGLKYIVLIGTDHSIPFFRYPDESGLGPENQYSPPVLDSGASQASLQNNYVLGQDAYGSSINLPSSDDSVPVPDLAVGRLVSTAGQVDHMLQVFFASPTITPTSSLVTGYDFVSDAATNAAKELAAGTGTTPDELIQQPGGAAWTADDLRQKLFGSRHDIVFMAGHFSAGNLLASDYSTQLAASEVASSTTDFTNTLFLILGCHGGYNIPSHDAIANISPSPSWTDALAEKGATLLASTGFAYGDTVLTEYGEHLFDNYVRQLRMGSGPVAVGQAEVAAKKEYLASHADLTGIDEKTLLETTLYGLPMLGVDLPAGRIASATSSSIVGGTTGVTSGPGANLSLSAATVDIQPTVTTHTVPLTNTVTNSTVTTTYLSGRDGTVAHPLDPINPLQMDDVHVPNQILRGVGFWGGTYTDTPGVTPLTTAPATENSVGHPAFFSQVFYPTQAWTANYFDAISGGDERLVTTPAQYESATNTDGSLSTSGTMRTFTDLKYHLYYLPSAWSSKIAQAAVGAASDIASVSATTNSSGQVSFNVRVLNPSGIGTQDVWVTYTDPSNPGTWTSIDLTRNASDPTLWQASAPLPSDIQFMVQAVNGTGLVSLSTNSGAYYTIGSPTPPTLAPTTVTLTSPPTSGAYQRASSFQVALASNGVPVAGKQVGLQLGGQEAFLNTDANGNATFNLHLRQDPGAYTVNAFFAGNNSYAASQTQPVFFHITKAPTVLTLATSSSSVPYSDDSGVTATLTDAAATPNPLPQRSVLFTVSGTDATGGTQSYQRSVITDDSGKARLGALALPAGTYTVSASFGGQSSSGVSDIDPDYQPSTGATSPSLTITPENLAASYNGDTVIPINSTLHLRANVSETDDGYPNDLSKAQVQFTVTDPNGSVVTTQTIPVTATSALTGAASIDVPGPSASNVYSVSVKVVGDYFASASTSGLLAVYNPNGGFTTGGGWFNSQSGWCTLASCSSNGDKASFGFNTAYQSGTTIPSGQTEFQIHGLDLKSASYQWMTISGDRVQFEGTGTVNGTGNYDFMVTAIDGRLSGTSDSTDYIRIQIWDPSTNTVIYDSQPGAASTSTPTASLGGGNIVVHSG